MNKTIVIDPFSPSTIKTALWELRQYQKRIEHKAQELAERLAQYGLQQVRLGYEAALYDGDKDVEVTVERIDDNTFSIIASGATVLILEFGAGVTYGYGHPDVGPYGPGTYPGQKHAMNPKGWWYTGSDGESHHSYGNVPSMVMYLTGMELEREVLNVAWEVFSR